MFDWPDIKTSTYVLAVFGLIAVIVLPVWGPLVLRRLERIRSKIDEVRQVRESCGAEHGCPFRDPTVNEVQLAMRSRLGPRFSLITCLGRRLDECLSEWGREALNRLFTRFIYACMILIGLYLLDGAFARDPTVRQLFQTFRIRDSDVRTIWPVILFAGFSLTELLAVLEIRGRYLELTGLAQKMLSKLE